MPHSAGSADHLRFENLFTRRLRVLVQVLGALAATVLALRGLAVGSPVAGLVQGGLAFLVMVVGPGSMHVRADAAGVTARNLFRTHRIAWADVRGFTLDDRFPYLAYLDVADGREIPLLAISDEPWLTVGRAHERNIAILEGLNRLWRTEVVRATTGTPALGSGVMGAARS